MSVIILNLDNAWKPDKFGAWHILLVLPGHSRNHSRKTKKQKQSYIHVFFIYLKIVSFDTFFFFIWPGWNWLDLQKSVNTSNTNLTGNIYYLPITHSISIKFLIQPLACHITRCLSSYDEGCTCKGTGVHNSCCSPTNRCRDEEQ